MINLEPVGMANSCDFCGAGNDSISTDGGTWFLHVHENCHSVTFKYVAICSNCLKELHGVIGKLINDKVLDNDDEPDCDDTCIDCANTGKWSNGASICSVFKKRVDAMDKPCKEFKSRYKTKTREEAVAS